MGKKKYMTLVMILCYAGNQEPSKTSALKGYTQQPMERDAEPHIQILDGVLKKDLEKDWGSQREQAFQRKEEKKSQLT